MYQPKSLGDYCRELPEGFHQQDQGFCPSTRMSSCFLHPLFPGSDLSSTVQCWMKTDRQFATNVAIQLVLFSTIVVGLFRKPNGPLEGAGNFFVKFLK